MSQKELKLRRKWNIFENMLELALGYCQWQFLGLVEDCEGEKFQWFFFVLNNTTWGCQWLWKSSPVGSSLSARNNKFAIYFSLALCHWNRLSTESIFYVFIYVVCGFFHSASQNKSIMPSFLTTFSRNLKLPLSQYASWGESKSEKYLIFRRVEKQRHHHLL